jgi:cytochrome c biogenesis protein CcmG/thiol:disulfide interchange protein DsbE
VLLVGIALLVVVVGLQLLHQSQSDVHPETGPAPDFTFTTYDGSEFSLSAQRGKVVLINFWGSWCGPCRDEAPELQALWDQYKDKGVMIVGVGYLDTEREALKYLQEFHITYPNGADIGSKISGTYHTRAVPESYILDKKGNVVRYIPLPIKASDVSALFDQLLAENS